MTETHHKYAAPREGAESNVDRGEREEGGGDPAHDGQSRLAYGWLGLPSCTTIHTLDPLFFVLPQTVQGQYTTHFPFKTWT